MVCTAIGKDTKKQKTQIWCTANAIWLGVCANALAWCNIVMAPPLRNAEQTLVTQRIMRVTPRLFTYSEKKYFSVNIHYFFISVLRNVLEWVTITADNFILVQKLVKACLCLVVFIFFLLIQIVNVKLHHYHVVNQ